MRVDVILHAGLLEGYDFSGKVVVVIDAFRATTVMVEALHNGAASVIPVATVDEALALKKNNPELLLGGERNGFLIDGFDIDNSPLSYVGEKINGAVVALTTTNGTRALKGVNGADRIYLGAFVNVSAAVARVADASDLVIVCSGSEDTVSLEDCLCASAIIYSLESRTSVDCSDAAYMVKSIYRCVKDDIIGYMSHGEHYRELCAKGFEKDVLFCLQVDKRTEVPSFDGTAVSL